LAVAIQVVKYGGIDPMTNRIGKLAIAGIAALTLALGSVGTADAAWGGHGGGHWGGGHWGGGHWGGWGGGWGVGAGVLGGLALGAALSSPYWGGYYDYGPYAYEPYGYGYAYEPYGYAYGPGCYIRRHVVIDRFGVRHIRRVRVCG
jgi:hypothetical protein